LKPPVRSDIGKGFADVGTVNCFEASPHAWEKTMFGLIQMGVEELPAGTLHA
jgi:hypothetical protein